MATVLLEATNNVDFARPKVRSIRPLYWLGAGGVVVAITLTLSRSRAAAPTVESGSVWVDTVRRGEMLRAVKGPGTLVPEHIRWISADTAGRVESIEVRPGASVETDTQLLELSNPDVMLQALEAERQVASAEAELIGLRASLTAEALRDEQAMSALEAQASDAARRAQANARLHESKLVSDIEALKSSEEAKALNVQLGLGRRQLHVLEETLRKRVAAQQAQLEKLRSVARFRQQLVSSMKVKAGGPGVLQELPLELGQWVTPGTLLAKVVRPELLRADLRIPETQAKDVSVGQRAEIDTRNGTVWGHVRRVAPSASMGSVLVEVELDGELPKGARPDLTVEGTIQIEKLENALYVGRPAGAQSDSAAELFRIEPGGEIAHRTRVVFGRGSVSTIEIRNGLKEGDRVVLSDMSAWDSAHSVRLR